MSTTFYIETYKVRSILDREPALLPISDRLRKLLDDAERSGPLRRLYEVGTRYSVGNGLTRVQWNWPGDDFWLLLKHAPLHNREPGVVTIEDLAKNDYGRDELLSA